MSLIFSASPGRHERHIKRLYKNPLFATSREDVNEEILLNARWQDEAELQAFVEGFQGLVSEAVALKPNEESDVLLQLKERLDKAFEEAARSMGDQAPIQSAIEKLLDLIMTAVRAGAGDDQKAHAELDQEDIARADHFRLLAFPIVADLLDPDSRIAEDDLLPALLSEPEDGLAAALQLFDGVQLELMVQKGAALLTSLESTGNDLTQAKRQLQQIEAVSKLH